jgi:uncharacterized small protein (TIGR04563 family)
MVGLEAQEVLTQTDESNYTSPLQTATSGRGPSERGGPMGGSDKRKQSLYFPEEMLKEIQEEATRQDRSLSWIVQKAWKISRKEIMKYPSVNEFPGEEDERGATE